MRALGLSKLLALGLLSAAMGCSSDYGLFEVHGQFPMASSGDRDREKVEKCKLSITNEKGEKVMEGFQLEMKRIPSNSALGYTLVGCGNTETPQDIGRLSYSTSRTTGSLNFTIDALDANTNVLFTGSSGAKPVKPFRSDGDMVVVDILIAKK